MLNDSTARTLSTMSSVVLLFGTVACSSAQPTANDLRPVSTSFTASASESPVNPSATTLPRVLGVVPTVTKVQLVITTLALSRSDDGNCASELDSSQCIFVTREPQLIDIPVDGTLHTQASTALPAGAYPKLEAKLAVPGSATPGEAAFLASHPEFAGSSLRVTGAFNGVPFTFKMALNANIQMRFSPALVIDGTSRNTTVAVDVSRWFVSMHGYVMDPSLAVPGTPAAAIIENNIRASFRAFADNQRRGTD